MHAYLIMAHHRPDLLKSLLAQLDDERNDIYLHIDARSPLSKQTGSLSTDHARLTLIQPMKVNWGGYSQVACEVRLLEAAVTAGRHDYYHLLTGASYPLKSQDYIHRFFAENNGREFVDRSSDKYAYRVQYVYPFNELGQEVRSFRGRLAKSVNDHARSLQHRLRIDRFVRFGMTLRKGLAYWSITHEFAEYLVANKELIRKMMRHSICGDEIFVATLLYNSPFREAAYGDDSDPTACLRASTWPIEDRGQPRPSHNFTLDDLDWLLAFPGLFALKFEGPDGPALIDAIRASIGDDPSHKQASAH